ncbi:hypothetical protein NDU88_005560 [Pleurodeles waltl]|uniref:Uncharacterized protein n=1 Tax=Pleurodeles waltl TaxID=8319 RepID=A0AAV7RMP4_PLEWA|nr:hypothetical protein NDU88_005560 [Pleurodeles waltl]
MRRPVPALQFVVTPLDGRGLVDGRGADSRLHEGTDPAVGSARGETFLSGVGLSRAAEVPPTGQWRRRWACFYSGRADSELPIE